VHLEVPVSATVSVVIPTFNCAPYIGEAIASLISQTRPPDDIVVVDDGSTDDTAVVVARFGGRVRYLRQENAGVSHARNRGLAEIASDWVMFLDADDRIEPTGLAALMDAAADKSRCVVYGDRQKITEDGRFLAHVPSRDCTGPAPSAARASFGGAAFEPGAAIVATDLARDIGGFDQRYSPSEDRHFWVRCGALAEFFYVPAPVLHYRVRPGSHSRHRPRQVVGSVRTRIDLLPWLNRAGVRLFDTDPDPAALLAEDLTAVYWTREWEAVDALLALADEYRMDNEEISAIRRRRRLPAWLLRVKDMADALARR
jgi:glycosyltransferase involved in cell wall biosynthesis